jgi:hypothetical protein
MPDWLKRDPKNGFLIGPDGCHYDNEHQAAHFGLLRLCGCGSPEDAYNFCREALACFDRRGCHDKPPKRDWINAEDALKKLIQDRPDDAAHVLAHLLTHLGLLEHGSSVGGSWLTDNGARIVDMGPATRDLMDEGRGL